MGIEGSQRNTAACELQVGQFMDWSARMKNSLELMELVMKADIRY